MTSLPRPPSNCFRYRPDRRGRRFFAVPFRGARRGFSNGRYFRGPILFLAGNVWLKVNAGNRFPTSHIVGIGILAVTGLVGSLLANYALSVAATVALLVTAVWEYHGLRKRSLST